MPLLNLTTLDDPILVDTCSGFAGGQRSFGPPDRLLPTQAAALLNIDLRDGTASTRRGTEALGAPLPSGVQGLFWYNTPAAGYLVAAARGALWKWDGNSWSGLSTWLSPVAVNPISLAQLADRLYIADGVSHLFAWDGSALTDLGSGGSTQPPIGTLLLSAQNRLWLAGLPAQPDTLCASQLLDGATWDATNLTLRIGGGDGDPITGLAELDDYQIAVFKRNSLYIVRADPALTAGGASTPLSHATVTLISDTIGCVSHRSIALVGSDLWFLSDGGVFTIGRVASQTQRELKPAASLPVQDVIDRIHGPAASTATAICWNHRYLLALPLDNDPQPTTVLVYNTLSGAWSGLWTGWSPQCWTATKSPGQERLVFGRPDGQVCRWLDYLPAGNEVESTYQDLTRDIPTALTTRAMTFAEPLCPKSLLNLQAEFFGSRATAALAVRLDEEQPITLRADFTTDPGELLLSFPLPATLPGNGLKRRAFGAQHLQPFRSLQATVTSSAGKLVLRGILASAFLNTLQIEE